MVYRKIKVSAYYHGFEFMIQLQEIEQMINKVGLSIRMSDKR